MKKAPPSMDQWLREAKADPAAKNCGMFLVHNGTVRQTAKALVRQGAEDTLPVKGMDFSCDRKSWPPPLTGHISCRGSITSVSG